MKNKIINLIEEDIKNTKLAIEVGKFLNPFSNLEEKVTEEKRAFAVYCVDYLEKYLIPKIKELSNGN